jgi:hypothetical protein
MESGMMMRLSSVHNSGHQGKIRYSGKKEIEKEWMKRKILLGEIFLFSP